MTWKVNKDTKGLVTWNYCVKGDYKINAKIITL